MYGLPDDRMVALEAVSPSPTFRIPGVGSFYDHLDATLRSQLKPVFFGPKLDLVVHPDDYRRPIINNITDPDIASVSLRMLARLGEQTSCLFFNHPEAILKSGRADVALALSELPGIQVPRTIRVLTRSARDLLETISGADLRWPLIVRIAGAHGGLGTVRIERASDVEDALVRIPWGGRPLYVTEYVDFRDTDGKYRKLRICVVGNQILARHRVTSGQWLVHSVEREKDALEEEIAFLDGFDSAILPTIKERVLAIADRLGLDYFGIDCSLRPDGILLLFEANAAMNNLLNSFPTPNCWEAPIGRIQATLASLLRNPGRWRCAAEQTPNAVQMPG